MSFANEKRAHRPSNQQVQLQHTPEVCPEIPFQPDALQQQILDSPAKQLVLCCSRQWGKSAIIALNFGANEK